MEQMKKSRKAVRAVFKKTANTIQELGLKTEVPSDELEVKWTILQEKHDNLNELNKGIYDILANSDADEAALIQEIEVVDEYEAIFQRIRNSINKQHTKAIEAQIPEMSTSQEMVMRKLKLPTLEMKKFGGEIKDWLPFWTQFLKIHEDPLIAPEDKFQYLQQAITAGKRARDLVDSFPLARENYPKAIEALKSRFGRDELLIEVYVRELLNFVLQNTNEKQSLSILYDKLETQLRALETLGVTTEKYEAMLFPLIESALPEELLRIWQRSTFFTQIQAEGKGNRLSNLMNFIKNEVEAKQRIALATAGFNIASDKNKKGRISADYHVPTAAGLINCNIGKCIFCDGHHNSENCFKIQKMSLDEKRQALARKKACYRCAKTGHQRKNCRERVKCLICGKQHVVFLCPELNKSREADSEGKYNDKKRSDSVRQSDSAEASLTNLANQTITNVFLQTIRVRMYSACESRIVRALFDSGSHRSYVFKSAARKLNYPGKRSQNMAHSLFGGTQTGEQRHNCYEVRVASLTGDYACKFEVMDQAIICNNISDIHEGVWTRELEEHGIELSDNQGSEPIELLIGADVAGKLLTGKRQMLKCGLVAERTLLGWVLIGKAPNTSTKCDTSLVVTSLVNCTRTIKEWWELDALGITEPKEKINKTKAYQLTKETFNKTITRDEEGRYEVRLPWIEDHPPLPTNECLAKQRLERTVRKIRQIGYYEKYHEVFEEWCEEAIIEKVPRRVEREGRHYLPHRPVIKESSTSTKVRPVFDASAREINSPALNDCLEKGENLIELIPEILVRFRREPIGVIADIKKAFLQISINQNDGDFLRFFWKDEEDEEVIFRHKRVVFGVNSSPFILAATMDYHLDNYLNKGDMSHSYSEKVVMKLKNSFYVYNCVTSVGSKEELQQFTKETTNLMAEGKFELRGWEHTNDANEESTCVLGLTWNKRDDTLSIWFKKVPLVSEKITKREILSAAQRIFDPIGFTSPVTLRPKLLLQNLWEQKVGWDQEVSEEIQIIFKKWVEELPLLEGIRISRWYNLFANDQQNVTLHVFCDASSLAYATAVFIRKETTEGVSIHLVSAKTRVTPIKRLSIPRLELLAATIGARLWSQVYPALKIEITTYFWSDSTTVLSWIRRKEEWSVFVWNRVQEIRQLTNTKYWNHVPGEKNPADLLSRGCSPKALTSSRWWEGPEWLYEKKQEWPQTTQEVDENEVDKERKKRASKILLASEGSSRFYSYFSKYLKNIRMIAWMFRFVHNSRNTKGKYSGELSAEEVNEAERRLIKIVQRESLLPLKKEIEHTLKVFKDEEGLLRVKSRLTNREDTQDFVCPYLLPAKHPITKRLIQQTHVSSCHVKGQGLMSILREKFWILGGRHTLRAVTNDCKICRRFDAKQGQVEAPSLPINRVHEAAVFEVIGIDIAGPLFLKDRNKVWICLFTCAVYRAVHLESVSSVSTSDFLNALRRFIARRGRPKFIYTDNGTNFRGADNLLNKLQWDVIQRNTTAWRISWRFSPPSAPWWGGWWERLIGSLKKLLKKSLGQACLTHEELCTILCDCEAVVNARLLTCVSNSIDDLKTLTPSMFLTEIKECGVPDLDKIDSVSLNRRHKYLQRLRFELRKRFRSEYLRILVRSDRAKNCNNISVGEIVLIGRDHAKRMDWPLARVIELLPGKDNVVRLVRLRTAHGQLLRPVQRLYTLEGIAHPVEMQTHSGDTEGANEKEVDLGAAGDNKVGENINNDCVMGDKCKVQNEKAVPYVTKRGRKSYKPKRYT